MESPLRITRFHPHCDINSQHLTHNRPSINIFEIIIQSINPSLTTSLGLGRRGRTLKNQRTLNKTLAAFASY